MAGLTARVMAVSMLAEEVYMTFRGDRSEDRPLQDGQDAGCGGELVGGESLTRRKVRDTKARHVETVWGSAGLKPSAYIERAHRAFTLKGMALADTLCARNFWERQR